MPVPREFEYVKPATLDNALALLAEYGARARILAGGTDLCLKIKEASETPEMLIDIKGLQELTALDYAENQLRIGAAVPFTRLIESPLVQERFPLLRDASATVGSVGIRNRATMGGNICSAVPSLDSGPALLVHEAVAHVKSRQGERRVPLLDWFVGPKRSALQPDEILTAISVPTPPKKAGACYVKLGRYAGEDLAQAGVGVLALEGHEYRIAFCAVGPVPTRARKIEALLQGNKLSEPVLKEAKALVPEEIAPISDIRSSKEYRTMMIKVMLERGLQAAVSALRGGRSEHGAIWV
ncbi:putative dehydrogenase, FAD binding subunit, medium chain [Candidatus Vecturithrix granuli]|uniref:Putative dehydrogenase, FAD binding subunit, medium chain n=1 Tax=Vecturithrix granuli TaxID=1499967 RepID=A0A081C9K2_VECG1|nr:putative dehydrogenase, FAD binding subunit, medium chain [Candidatus Vecturithrix granuli]